MDKEIRLSPDAILYSAANVGASTVTGVPDTLSGLKKEDYPEFTKRAEEELLKCGLMEMDFDGNVNMKPDFKALIKRLTGANTVTFFNIRKTGDENIVYVAYEKDGEFILSEKSSKKEGVLTLSEFEDAKEIKDRLLSVLTLPAGENELTECAVSTAVLKEKDKDKISGAAADEKTADLIYDSLVRKADTLKITRIKDKRQENAGFILTGSAGAMTLKVTYTEDDELLSYSPISVSGLEAIIDKALKGDNE